MIAPFRKFDFHTNHQIYAYTSIWQNGELYVQYNPISLNKLTIDNNKKRSKTKFLKIIHSTTNLAQQLYIILRVVPLRRPSRRGGNNQRRRLPSAMYKMFYKTKYKLYTTSLNILKCCNTFKTFHIQLGIIQLARGSGARVAAPGERRGAVAASLSLGRRHVCATRLAIL